jgi:hypothetical protein
MADRWPPHGWPAEVVQPTGTRDRHAEDRTYGLKGWGTGPHWQRGPDHYGADRDSVRARGKESWVMASSMARWNVG